MSTSLPTSDLATALSLAPPSFLDLSDRLIVLYGARSLGQLLVAAVDLLRPPFFAADSISVGFTDPSNRRHIAIARPGGLGSPSTSEQYRRYAHQSPMLQYWQRTGDHDRVLRRSDCCNPSEYAKTALFNEVDRPGKVVQHIGTWFRPGRGRHLEVGMSRSGKTDFNPDDVHRLSILRKHIFRSYLNVCDFQRLEATHSPSHPLAPTQDIPPDAFELQDTSLTQHLDPTLPDPQLIQLTPREREVLYWIVEGKTNREIGIILSISWRTVRLHCERIFRKLNVETRTTAAVRALELGLKL